MDIYSEVGKPFRVSQIDTIRDDKYVIDCDEKIDVSIRVVSRRLAIKICQACNDWWSEEEDD